MVDFKGFEGIKIYKDNESSEIYKNSEVLQVFNRHVKQINDLITQCEKLEKENYELKEQLKNLTNKPSKAEMEEAIIKMLGMPQKFVIAYENEDKDSTDYEQYFIDELQNIVNERVKKLKKLDF